VLLTNICVYTSKTKLQCFYLKGLTIRSELESLAIRSYCFQSLLRGNRSPIQIRPYTCVYDSVCRPTNTSPITTTASRRTANGGNARNTGSLFLEKSRFSYLRVMLWSHVKLMPYSFSDLQITGKFDNRPGTGSFLRFFSCVVTYRSLPGRHWKRLTGHRTVPGRFYVTWMKHFHMQWYINIKTCHHSSKETGC